MSRLPRFLQSEDHPLDQAIVALIAILLVMTVAMGLRALYGREPSSLTFSLYFLCVGALLLVTGIRFLQRQEATNDLGRRFSREERPFWFWTWTFLMLLMGGAMVVMSVLAFHGAWFGAA